MNLCHMMATLSPWCSLTLEDVMTPPRLSEEAALHIHNTLPLIYWTACRNI